MINGLKSALISNIYDAFIDNESALRRYLARFVYRAEDIDDMIQETFLRAYKATDSREIDYPKAYLFRVAKSVAVRQLSKKANQVTDFMDEASIEAANAEEEAGKTVEQEVEAAQKIKIYCDAIAELPPQCRRVFLMRKYQALSHKEIATKLNVSVGAVEKQITLGIKRCRIYMDNLESTQRELTPTISEKGDAHE